jgi:ribonuclease P/MRP protein subunit RPP40
MLQFGFREKHSTYLAMISLMENIINSLERGHFTIGLFLDFSKAFDTVNHKILISKLNHYGIRGIANKWITSYLTGREQYTSYNGANSQTKTIKCGVPQGSILGPILFLIYINDLGTFSDKLATIMFADDSNLFSGGNDLTQPAKSVNDEIPQLITWLRANRLFLNISKTHFMIFGPKKKNLPKEIDMIIDGKKIDHVKSTKFLGIILDTNITWKDHIMHLTKKIARSVGILSIAKKILNIKSLIQLYFSFVYPYITYCILIWGNSPAPTLWPIFKLQKMSFRIINNLRRQDSS